MQLLEVDPTNAAAHINLGTICYNRRELESAERHYRVAILHDPNYALAYFDLGNVLDETARYQEAIDVYQTALRLAPNYADAHYNLALTYDRHGKKADALRHWRAYVALDRSGPWHAHAERMIAMLAPYFSPKVEWRNPSPKRTKRRAKLILVKR